MAGATNERMKGKSNTLAMLAAGVAELDPIFRASRHPVVFLLRALQNSSSRTIF